MPNRILKESICYSPSVEGLTWFEEVCFYRLLVQCDDFGRCDARPPFLRAKLFPLREDIDSDEVADAMRALSAAGMLEFYEVNDRPYLQIVHWRRHQRVRTRRAKYPEPPIAFYDEEYDGTQGL